MSNGMSRIDRPATLRLRNIVLVVACAAFGFGATNRVYAIVTAHANQRAALLNPISITPSSVDFGSIVEDAPASRSVLVRNLTGHDLKIQSARPSCGCTNAQLASHIPAGGSAPLTVTYDTVDYPGAIHQYVYISFADQSMAPITVPVDGMVVQEVSMYPKTVQLPADRALKTAVLLTSVNPKEPLRITGIECPPSLATQIVPISLHSARLSISLGSPSLAGWHTATIRVHLTDSLLPVIAVPVQWTTRGIYHVFPSKIDFGVIAQPGRLERTVFIVGPKASPKLHVLSAPSGLSAQVGTGKRPNEICIRLSGSAEIQKGGILHTNLVLGTEDAREPRIVVPVYAVRLADDASASTEACVAQP